MINPIKYRDFNQCKGVYEDEEYKEEYKEMICQIENLNQLISLKMEKQLEK